jgi:hypothetical protein
MPRFLTAEQKAESSQRAKTEKLCRWCGLDVHRLSKKRRTFCSDECVHEFNIRSSASYIRIYIAKRDKYICQICGLDCKGFVRQLWRYVNDHIQELQKNPVYAGHNNYRHAMKVLQVEFFDLHNMEWVNTHGRSTFYDIDHIHEVIKGGGQCGEENLRLLCLACHRKETARLRAELKKANSAASDSASPQAPESPSSA